MRGVWSGASSPSQRVMAWACGPFSASCRGTPAAICSAANESSTREQRSRLPSSGSQYARLSPTQPTTSRLAVQDAGHERARGRARRAVGGRGEHRGVGGVGRLDQRRRDQARPGRRRCPARAGAEAASTSRAARAPARLATSESIEDETPSQTTSTARVPGSGSAATATASSLRGCRTPRSQTAATQGAGCSTKWSRGLGRLGAARARSSRPRRPSPPQAAQTGAATGISTVAPRDGASSPVSGRAGSVGSVGCVGGPRGRRSRRSEPSRSEVGAARLAEPLAGR